MKIEFNPSNGLIVIPTRLYGVDADTIARMALDTGEEKIGLFPSGYIKKITETINHNA